MKKKRTKQKQKLSYWSEQYPTHIVLTTQPVMSTTLDDRFIIQ